MWYRLNVQPQQPSPMVSSVLEEKRQEIVKIIDDKPKLYPPTLLTLNEKMVQPVLEETPQKKTQVESILEIQSHIYIDPFLNQHAHICFIGSWVYPAEGEWIVKAWQDGLSSFVVLTALQNLKTSYSEPGEIDAEHKRAHVHIWWVYTWDLE